MGNRTASLRPKGAGRLAGLFAAALLLLLAACVAREGGRLATPEDLNAPGRLVGVPQGAAAMTAAERRFPKARIEYFTAVHDGYAALQSGKLDAFAFDRHSLRYVTRMNPDLALLDERIADEFIVVGVPPGQEALLEEVNGFIRQYRADGTYRDMYRRWIEGQAPRLPDLPRPANPRRTLRIGTNGLSEPMNFYADGRLTGFDIEFARRLGLALDADITFQTLEFPSLVAGAASGKLDLVVSNLNGTPERRKSMLFSDTYVDSEIAVVVRRDRLAPRATQPITSLGQLSGRKVGVITGSVFDGLLKARIPDAVPVYFDSFPDQLEALRTGKTASFFMDEPGAKDVMARTSGVAFLKEPLASDGYAFAFARDRAELRDQVDGVLKEMRSAGVLAALEAKWFGKDEAAKVMPEPKPLGRKAIRYATQTTCPPFAYLQDGRIVGFEIEIAARVAERLGRDLEIVPMDFGAMLPSLVTGRNDMAGGCITVTPERAKSVHFSSPTYAVAVVAMVATGAEGPGSGGALAEFAASFRRTFLVEGRYRLVLQGLKVTLVISLLSACLGTLLGFGVCLLRRSRRASARVPAMLFIRTIQGTPIIVLMMILYYIVFRRVDINGILVAVIAFSINFAAYVSEMMRTGIDAVDRGQVEAAAALGFNRLQVSALVVFPQAARHVLPVFKGEFVSMLKMTSVVGYIAIQDLTKMSDIIRSRTYEAFFPLLATALIYFAIASLLAWLLSRIEISIDPRHRKRIVDGEVLP